MVKGLFDHLCQDLVISLLGCFCQLTLVSMDTVGYPSLSEDLLLSAVRALRALLLSLDDRLVSVLIN